MFESSPAKASAFADHEDVNVIIETPALSRTKYAWDPDARAFAVTKVLPLGTSFPYDFGFVCKTKASDGDPLDALVLADEPLALGCLVVCRVLGAVQCKTSEHGATKAVRNDRLITVPRVSLIGAGWHDVTDVGDRLLDEIAAFLADYTRREGRVFELLGTVGRAAALQLVSDAQT